MDWKLGYGTLGLIALTLTGGLVWYNIANAPIEIPATIAFSEPALLLPHPELDGFFLNINRASVEELKLLPGIGEKRAQDIYDFVHKRGGITRFEQLLEVEGIGDGTLENIVPYLTI